MAARPHCRASRRLHAYTKFQDMSPLKLASRIQNIGCCPKNFLAALQNVRGWTLLVVPDETGGLSWSWDDQDGDGDSDHLSAWLVGVILTSLSQA